MSLIKDMISYELDLLMINKNSKISVMGKGLIGSAVLRKLENLSYRKIYTKSKKSLDLRDQKVLKYF